MPIKYTVVKYHNPQGEENAVYYRPRVVKTDDYTAAQLERDINDATSLSDVDVHSALFAINKQLRKELLSGRTIVLDGIGRISIGMTASSITEEERSADGFSPAKYIKSLHLNFRPCASILKELKEMREMQYIPEK